MPLLSIQDLHLEISRPGSHVSVLHGVNLHVDAGEIVGLVGETGSGKTLTAMSILNLLPSGARFTAGVIHFDGVDICRADAEQIHQLRGRAIGAIFQQPRAALNPTRPVVDQVADRYADLLGLGRRAALDAAFEQLRQVGIPDPRVRGKQYPHQLSGGMCQRVMVAMAIAAGPRLLLADEPTTGLDVTLQDQILRLITNLSQAAGMAVLLITHDLAVVAQTCQRVAVMYAGEVVESGPTDEILSRPKHPYTVGLIEAVAGLEAGRRPEAIPGVVPRFRQPPHFCPFVDRCPRAFDRCRVERPQLRALNGQEVACHLYAETTTGEAR
ncbi:ATP-binding cassette domain-containing protein [bacterium]|nr:ATP-binding cassette domain-containing protein [bacterium]